MDDRFDVEAYVHIKAIAVEGEDAEGAVYTALDDLDYEVLGVQVVAVEKNNRNL